VQTKTEKVNQSWWYPTYPNDLTQESSQEIALAYATDTQDELVNAGIPKEIMIVEQRGGLDNLYTRATSEGREKNYRAMVTMYISKDKDADSDNDGVIDTQDKCKFTPAGHKVNKDGCSEILNLTINYKVNSSDIQDVSLAKLIKMVDFMKKNLDFKALVYGHTSNEGTFLNNQILSEKRALSIRKYLMEQGINSSRISVYGRSSTQPISSNDTAEGREENRRVEIKLF
jgi:outer membrane protein OmpA-like peptidoglycan-associated protein